MTAAGQVILEEELQMIRKEAEEASESLKCHLHGNSDFEPRYHVIEQGAGQWVVRDERKRVIAQCALGDEGKFYALFICEALNA